MAKAIHVERCMRRGRMHGVVDGELDHRQKLTPTRKRVDVPSKDLFEDAIGAFSLTISLRMVRSRHCEPCSKCLEHGAPKCSREPGVPIGHKFTG